MEDILNRMAARSTLPKQSEALPDRDHVITPVAPHAVLRTLMSEPYPEGCKRALFGLGCFWGAEKKFWQMSGIYTTAVGYSGGYSANPTYEDVCSGKTGHNEVVLVVFKPDEIGYEALLATFWESHDPRQGMRQGNDVGTQYRSGIYTYDDEQNTLARASREKYQRLLDKSQPSPITTEIVVAGDFFFAEDYHQQYLAENPGGYCGLGGTGVAYQ